MPRLGKRTVMKSLGLLVLERGGGDDTQRSLYPSLYFLCPNISLLKHMKQAFSATRWSILWNGAEMGMLIVEVMMSLELVETNVSMVRVWMILI